MWAIRLAQPFSTKSRFSWPKCWVELLAWKSRKTWGMQLEMVKHRERIVVWISRKFQNKYLNNRKYLRISENFRMELRSLTCAVVPHGTLWRASAQRQFWAPGKLRAPKGTQEISKTLVLWKLKKIGIGRISLCSQFSETHLTQYLYIFYCIFIRSNSERFSTESLAASQLWSFSARTEQTITAQSGFKPPELRNSDTGHQGELVLDFCFMYNMYQYVNIICQ